MNTTDRPTGSDTARKGLVRGIISLIRRHPVVSSIAAAGGLGLAIFVLAYFQPYKLFIDDRVNEAIPTASGPDGSGSAGANSEPQIVSTGAFTGLAHPGAGNAHIIELGTGDRLLRFEDFEVDNGPDLFVYLSTTASGSPESSFPGDFVSLGKLKGNIGNQNYEIPTSIDLSRYLSVVIYCKRFSTPFASAPLG